MGCPLFGVGLTLDYRNIDSGRALLPFFDVKGNPVAFIERLESTAVNSRVMYEYIGAVFLLDEAIAFSVVKPFHNTIRHSDILL